MDDDELDFPFAGPTRFEGLELPQQLTCNPRALREGYLESLRRYLDEVAPWVRPVRRRLRARADQPATRRRVVSVLEQSSWRCNAGNLVSLMQPVPLTLNA